MNLPEFIKKNVVFRDRSFFEKDIENNRETLSQNIKGKKVLVIGGAGSIGSSFIKAVLPFQPEQLCVVDINENGLVELTRDLRSSFGMYVPQNYLSYTLDFSNPIFERIFRENNGFDIVANFSAHKHVRSEKDKYSVQALIQNNVFKAEKLMKLLTEIPPQHFFCVSTDKAANPVNVMGASKKMMEELIMAYSSSFKVTTARFANVAFSNGSLPASFIDRLNKNQPLVAPNDVKRYFVSPEESGQICMLACILGHTGEIFFPKLKTEQMSTFDTICTSFLREHGYEPLLCSSEEEAKTRSSLRKKTDKEYPVFYFKSDTSGEKDFEEFFVEGENIDLDSFESLGVIKESTRKTIQEVTDFIKQLNDLFLQKEFTKGQIIETIHHFIPNFDHIEKGKNLDQKM